MLAAVDRIRYRRQNTNMTGGLKVARLEVFGGRNYDQRPNAGRIIVLITDGVPTRDVDKLDDEVAAIKRMGIRIVGLGITNQVCLLEVCTGPFLAPSGPFLHTPGPARLGHPFQWKIKARVVLGIC